MNKTKQQYIIFIILLFLILISVAINLLIFKKYNYIFLFFNKELITIVQFEKELNNLIKTYDEITLKHHNNFDLLLDHTRVVDTDNINFKDTKYDFSSQHLLRTQLSKQIKKLKLLDLELKEFYDIVKLWRRDYNVIFNDISNKSSLVKVRSLIEEIRKKLFFLKGVNDLEEAKLLVQFNKETSTNVKESYSKLISFINKKNNLKFNQSISEINRLSVLTESLYSETNYYNLSDIKDNEIKQSLMRLYRYIYKLQFEKNNLSQNISLNDILFLADFLIGETLFLNKEYNISNNKSLYIIRHDFLKLIEKNNNYKQFEKKYFKKIYLLLSQIKNDIYLINKNQSKKQNLLLSNTKSEIKLYSLLYFTLYLIIALIIISLIKYLRKINQKSFNEINSIIESSGDAIRVIDSNGVIFRVNSKMAELMGCSIEEAIGIDCYKYFQNDNFKEDSCCLKVFKTKKPVRKEIKIKNSSGKIISYDMISTPLIVKEKVTKVISTYRDISKYKKMQEEIEFKNNVLTERDLKLNNALEKLKLSHNELKKTQNQLINSEKMASIGQLSAGVAHEINNPTGFVLSNLNVLSRNFQELYSLLDSIKELINNYYPKENNTEFHVKFDELMNSDDIVFLKDDIPDLINESIEGAQRIKKIVQNLKEFAHPGEEEKSTVNINDQIQKALVLVNNEIKYNCKVELDLADIPEINANNQQIEQVFINLIINASHAIEKNGLIKIITSYENSLIVIKIIDNGKGIERENLQKIFNPFFTTKAVGKGTGLGLSIIYGIIKDHGGNIQVDSTVGVGTTFTISFPV